MDVNTPEASLTAHRSTVAMSDEERVTILADIILEAISSEDEQG